MLEFHHQEMESRFQLCMVDPILSLQKLCIAAIVSSGIKYIFKAAKYVTNLETDFPVLPSHVWISWELSSCVLLSYRSPKEKEDYEYRVLRRHYIFIGNPIPCYLVGPSLSRRFTTISFDTSTDQF